MKGQTVFVVLGGTDYEAAGIEDVFASLDDAKMSVPNAVWTTEGSKYSTWIAFARNPEGEYAHPDWYAIHEMIVK